MFKRLYQFLQTPQNRGIGTSADALLLTYTQPIQSMYGPRYNVQKSLNATRPGTFKGFASVPIASLEGNGSYIQGQLALQNLIDLKREQEGA